MFRILRITQRCLTAKPSLPKAQLSRSFHEEFTQKDPVDKLKKSPKANTPASANVKFQIFRDEDAEIIFDVEEERTRIMADSQIERQHKDPYDGLNLQRGVNGVFEIEDLVEVLRQNNAVNICVCSVPKDIKYVDYMCIVSGISYRHMMAIAQFVRKMYKMKRHSGDILPKVEGENSKDWMAMDLGNIALHIFSEEARELYDLESLWAVGADFDGECNKPKEPLLELFERHSVYLGDLTPKQHQ